MHTIEWRAGDWLLVARPVAGGALLQCRFGETDILRPAKKDAVVTETAAFPMLPFVGRIENGRFAHQGKAYGLVPNLPPEPHTLHGVGWQSDWWADVTSNRLEMRLEQEDPRWPWPFSASQIFTATANTLNVTLSVSNPGRQPMPAGLGWHPYFLTGQAKLRASVPRIWDAEPGHVASASVPPQPEQSLTDWREVEQLDIDHCFDWHGSAEVALGNGATVAMSASDNARWLIVFTPPGQEAFCVEPVSHVPNAINMSDPAAVGMMTLAPGETLSLTVQLRVS